MSDNAGLNSLEDYKRIKELADYYKNNKEEIRETFKAIAELTRDINDVGKKVFEST